MASSARESKLRKLFYDVTKGTRKIKIAADARLFFESVLAQETPSKCVEIIVTSDGGLEAIRSACRADFSTPFLLKHTLPFVDYLADESVKALANGYFLLQILSTIVSPPTVWTAIVQLLAQQQQQHDSKYLQSLAWLTLEMLDSGADFGFDVQSDAQRVMTEGKLLQAESRVVREIAYKIDKILQLRSKAADVEVNLMNTAGGRHDNDFADFKKIAIYPTADEVLSTATPFYRTVHEVFGSDLAIRSATHLDNQFRLLREDMIPELRDDMQVTSGRKRGKISASLLKRLYPVGIGIGDDKRPKKMAVHLTCQVGLEALQKVNPNGRAKFLSDNRQFLKHQSFGGLCIKNECVAFAFVDRDEALLTQNPPVVSLQFVDTNAMDRALYTLKTNYNAVFMLVDTPVFAYEPVLKGLKSLSELPFQDALVDPGSANLAHAMDPRVRDFVRELRTVVPDGNGLIRMPAHGLKIDQSQRDAIASALENNICIIQGPPGTGKSFVGAQIIKHILRLTDRRALVISYTNHAVDQFAEDLMHVGIPAERMVRLGSKSTVRTKPLLLSNQPSVRTRESSVWKALDQLKDIRHDLETEVSGATEGYLKPLVNFDDIMEFLEFMDAEEDFYNAFQVKQDQSGFKQVGKKGRDIARNYLYDRWVRGYDAGSQKPFFNDAMRRVWALAPGLRQSLAQSWVESIIRERTATIASFAEKINELWDKNEELLNESKVNVLKSKRIILSTTTAAAMHNKLIRAAEPDVVIVEEAGEILEAHILTALTPSVKQLIQIGDHKQLPPKINNYALSIEKGEGFDLNRSMFERLIRQGVPHTTLQKQHRMHPDIAAFPRALTYPDLLDDPKTLKREPITGVQDRVVFVHHEHPEGELNGIVDRHDPTVKSSKHNHFEADMTLKCVRYLSQQGYKTENMVVLTPYLGQLRLLFDKLKQENDPILNDLDSHDLLRAGLMTNAAAHVEKRPLRISTIDNYQGEESDIVIACLTRSNGSGDIGFMAAPERLNVLMSRARCGIILLGNMNTFMASKKGKQTWTPFFKLLKEGDHLYDGLPVYCERHPDRSAILGKPEDFDRNCRDGGCFEECGALLSCGRHKCQFRCHRVTDHSKAECRVLVEVVCKRQHKCSVPCTKKDQGCALCAKEDRETERRMKRDLALEKKRYERQQAYTAELEQIQDELDHHRRIVKYIQEEEEEKKTLAQERANAETMRETAKKIRKLHEQRVAKETAKSTAAGASRDDQAAEPAPGLQLASTARDDWEYHKDQGAQNAALDKLMSMVGLEAVKQEFLETKLSVDTAIRRETSLSSQRFSCSLLGNPGTGKTTVARLYAEFLGSVGVLPGACFKETTGAALANGGVNNCQKLIQDILNEGGGVLFIDEAYQLTSGNSAGGKAVLDFLWPEVENLTGKVVFVLAGYNKEMENFFAHNPGLSSRFPITMKFEDYSDAELLHIFQLKLHKEYNGRMVCEDGVDGLYCRIIATRIGRGRGQQGFGNARTVENVLAQVSRRQVTRLHRELRKKLKPNDFLFTRQDLIGPEPSNALQTSKGWRELQTLIGLRAVKESIKAMVDTIQQNYVRELAEQPIIEYSLNKVFLGNPGTGKTTVAKLYGSILVDLGMLSKGEVIVKNPSDFVGAALGQSEQQTRGILAAAVGKVLVIDEAYGLYGGSGIADPYKTGVIDTIVAEVQSIPGDDRCVLLLGYKEQMETMMQNVNPGLSRRFPTSSAFNFEDFEDEEMRKILNIKLNKQSYQATDQGKGVVKEMLSRARNRPNFGNAGEIDIILDSAKARHQTRFSKGEAKNANLLEAIDFDEDFDRADRSDTNVEKLFEDTVGCDGIVGQLKGYQEAVKRMKPLGIDPKESIPFNFLFRGPPGTGKTTTAKKMGKVFYDMGFLAKAEVEECSATDLIGQYVGQTGPKVQAMMERALGRVLFIDEAYRLAEGHFAKEAMDEIVDCVTKPKYFKRLVIILAGYDQDINRLMKVNPGLTSRFPEVVDFRSLSAPECIALLLSNLRTKKAKIEKMPNIILDLGFLEDPIPQFREKMETLFTKLSAAEGWASARDVLDLARKIFNETTKQASKIANKGQPRRMVLLESVIEVALSSMLAERSNRAAPLSGYAGFPNSQSAMPVPQMPGAPPNLSTSTRTETTQEEDPANLPEESVVEPAPPARPSRRLGKRDAGVSDEVWEQLQRDAEAEDQREEEYQKLKAIKVNEISSEARKKILERLLKEERRREEEARARAKIEAMGRCPAGFQWIKSSGGYRCGGGSHWIDDSQLA